MIRDMDHGEHSSDEPTNSSDLITFHCADKVFALPMDCIKEVGLDTGATMVPHNSKVLKGLTTYQGKVIPSIDQGSFSGSRPRAARKHSSKSMRLIVDIDPGLLCIVVDGIGRVISPSDLNLADSTNNILKWK